MGELTWRVEDVRVCLDCDPDAARAPARQVQDMLTKLSSSGWNVHMITNLAGRDLGEAVIFIIANKKTSGVPIERNPNTGKRLRIGDLGIRKNPVGRPRKPRTPIHGQAE